MPQKDFNSPSARQKRMVFEGYCNLRLCQFFKISKKEQEQADQGQRKARLFLKQPGKDIRGTRQQVWGSLWISQLSGLRVRVFEIILKGNQSCSIEKEAEVRRVYINKMSKGKELFLSLVAKVKACGQIHQILKSQVDRYQIQPLKSQTMDCATIQSLYSSLEFKYFKSHELPEDPETWNDNQKKLFIWVIIFYAHFLEQDGQQMTPEAWDNLSPLFFGKSPDFLHFQYLNLIKPQGKISWTPEEDALLTRAVAGAGEGHWNEVSRWYFNESKHQLFKSPKHCRERWLNHLDDKKKKGNWTPEEDLVIFRFVAENGKRWCKLVPVLEGTRTEHMIKNRFNSLLNRQKHNRRETDDQLLHRIIRQLKKQIVSFEKRKQKREEQLKKESPKGQPSLEEEFQPKAEVIDEEPFGKEVEKNSEGNEEKISHTPASVESTLKKEASQDQTYLVPEVERVSPLEMPFYPIPPYFNSNLQDYPFLLQQQMEFMSMFMPFAPYRAC